MNPSPALSAGPIRARLGSGLQLADITFDGHIALDAIYYAVRDRDWNTTGQIVEDEQLTQTEEGFDYHAVLRHASERIDIRTTADIAGTNEGLEISFSAEALVDQEVNRVGLCVLHPLELTAHPLTVQTVQGTGESEFPARISANQPFLGVKRMTQTIARNLQANIEFGGALFETEDHRNWTDAGWKTYSPPLDVPHPFRLKAGDVLHQRIRLTSRKTGPSQPNADAPLQLTVNDRSEGRLPRIGLGASGVAIGGSSRDALRSIAPAFVLVELVGESESVGRFEQALREARLLRTSLSVLLACTVSELDWWGRRFRHHAEDIDSVTVVDPISQLSSPELLQPLRQQLHSTSIRVAGGTRGYFAEFNRNVSRLGQADLLRFTVSPEVHHTDDERIFDTTRAQPAVMMDAHRLRPDAAIAVGPITLAQRLNLQGDVTDYLPYSHSLRVDPRTSEQFAAAWVVGTIAGLARSESLAFFTTEGDGGVVDHGSLTPAGRVLAALADCEGAELLTCDVSHPRLFGALALRTPLADFVLLANFRPSEVVIGVALSGAQHEVPLGPYEVRKVG